MLKNKVIALVQVLMQEIFDNPVCHCPHDNERNQPGLILQMVCDKAYVVHQKETATLFFCLQIAYVKYVTDQYQNAYG